MRTRIKICCIRSLEEARLAIASGADAVGFVGVHPPTPRTIGDHDMDAITAHIPPPVTSFLLSSATRAEAIARQASLAGVSAVQIVTALAPYEYVRLSGLAPTLRRVQVIHVKDESVLGLIERHARHVHAFLLDSGKPDLPVPEYGGTGKTHDWSVSAEFVRRSPIPVFLAGGLTPENVCEALKVVRPFGVDVCSGVRRAGRLDSTRLESFVNAVKSFDAADNE